MRLAAFQPDNPYNLGALIRLSACFGTPLDVIEPCGFPLSERVLRKTALDYGARAEIRRHDGWASFAATRAAAPPARLVALSVRGETPIWSHDFQFDDILLLGRESKGLPAEILDAADARLCIPMPGGGRSLNVAMAAAVALGEALRQMSTAGS
ncbi:MAG: TrmH family RNA methyltransferase [Pseudomonadota bacterium]